MAKGKRKVPVLTQVLRRILPSCCLISSRLQRLWILTLVPGKTFATSTGAGNRTNDIKLKQPAIGLPEYERPVDVWKSLYHN